MNYKVCILTAGVGSRIGKLTQDINKALLPVDGKAVISHIIEKFPFDTEFVIGVGHLKETVIDYVTMAYPEHKFFFVEIDKYKGEGTGPGYSLLQCREQLKCPFIFVSCDTIVQKDVPPPSKNWFGVAEVDATESYASVQIVNDRIVRIDDKLKTDNKYAFIGLAGIFDYEIFFDGLEHNTEMHANELQVSNGFNALIDKGLLPEFFTWYDTGTIELYTKTRLALEKYIGGFDFSKGDEFLYFVNGRVIKFFADGTIAKNRYLRAIKFGALCPPIEKHSDHFYSYKRVEGENFYEVLNTKNFKTFLQWMQAEVWQPKVLSEEEDKKFLELCDTFYRQKTYARIARFFERTNTVDSETKINGVAVPSLAILLEKINWNEILRGTPSMFHGDLVFDNILVNANPLPHPFTLLDWRQDFGGSIEYGDLYYDLAKLYASMTMSYALIKRGLFTFHEDRTVIRFEYLITNILAEIKEVYEAYLLECGYHVSKVKVLTAIIFLNMAALHNNPFDKLVFYQGKYLLYTCIAQQ